MNSISLMEKAALPFNVITTVNSLNIAELPAMLELLLSAGVRFWRLQGIIPMGRVREHPSLLITQNDILQLGRFIREQRKRIDKNVMHIICSDGLEYVMDSEQDEPQWQGCSAGIVACGITSDGKIKGCLSMPDELVSGDLRKNDLWDIWFHNDSFGYTRRFSMEGLGSNCADCDKAVECKGGCSSSSYCSTGHFHNDPYCFYKADSSAM
jgi:radical SAM protein with 4Fe4S-binding SPASM domain